MITGTLSVLGVPVLFDRGLAVRLNSTVGAVALSTLLRAGGETKRINIPLTPTERVDALAVLAKYGLLVVDGPHDDVVRLDRGAVDKLAGMNEILLRTPHPLTNTAIGGGVGARLLAGLNVEAVEPPPATLEDVLSGKHDSVPRKTLLTAPAWLLGPLAAAWGEAWGVRAPRVTKQRRAAWIAFVREQGAPSTFAQAMLGMRHDDWPDRPKHNDWGLVVKSADRWVAMFKENGRPRPAGAKAAPTKLVKSGTLSIAVPADYSWTPSDDHMAASGKYLFDLETRKWKERKA